MNSSPNARRGRPNHEDLARRIQEGQLTQGDHKCRECERTFPRRKSLIAHERTHTGEKPYPCTFPSCGWSFKQSGQLKTHIGRHTGILPFKCPISDCSMRYLHNNRMCRVHALKVKSDGKLAWSKIPNNLTPEKRAWIQEHRAKAEAQKRTETGVTSNSPLGMPLREIDTNSPSKEDQCYITHDKLYIPIESNFENIRHTSPHSTSSESDENKNYKTHLNLYIKGSESPDSGNQGSYASEQSFTEPSDRDSSDSGSEWEDIFAGRTSREAETLWVLSRFTELHQILCRNKAEAQKKAESQAFVTHNNLCM